MYCAHMASGSHFGEMVRRSRTGKRLSQAKLAELSGISRQTINRIEGGSSPELATAVALARTLQLNWTEVGEVAEAAESYLPTHHPSVESRLAAIEAGYAAELAEIRAALADLDRRLTVQLAASYKEIDGHIAREQPTRRPRGAS